MTAENGAKPVPPAPWQQTIPAERLHPGPCNPRKDPGDLKGLAASIRENGLKHRILVYPAPDISPDDYYIEDGWRRYLAMKDWRTDIPCDVRPGLGRVEVQAVVTALVTDAYRKNLNPMERAEGLGALADQGLSGTEISRLTGLHVTTVSNGLKLLKFADADREKIRSGELPADAALKIIRRLEAKDRKKKGLPRRGTRWEPDHFTDKHGLARLAAVMCDAREHNSRRRRGGACDHCWEDAIRADQDKITRAQVKLEAEARDRVQQRGELLAKLTGGAA